MNALTPAPRARFLDLPDGDVHLLDWGGEGQALHFAHANGFNARTYTPLLGALADKARLFASDLRGHGSTRLPADPAAHKSWSVYPQDLIRVLEAIGAGPYVLAGHSMGGTTSLLVAGARPDLVKALVLFEPVAMAGPMPPGYDPENSPYVQGAVRRRPVFADADAARRAYTGRGAFATWPAEMLDAYLAGGLTPDAEGMRLACAPAWEAQNFRLGPPPLADILPRVTSPITILHGTIGSTTAPAFLERLAEVRPDARIHKVEGATHFLPMERPDLARAALLDAL